MDQQPHSGAVASGAALPQADIVVVGGGSAGCAMAARLAEGGQYRVVLLEAGRPDGDLRTRIPALTSAVVQNPAFDWCYKTEPDPSIGGRADTWPAGKRLGGGSTINGMMFIRGHRWDYDHWAELGATGWDYASVLPYFRRMERNEAGGDAFRGDAGPLSVSELRVNYPITQAWIDSAVQAGIPRNPDLNGADAEGVDRVQVSQERGMRCSASRAYLHRGAANPPQVITQAQATRIVIEDGRAVGVEFLQDGQPRTLRAQRGVVVCAGTMNSPRLLMLSGIGPAEHLAAHGIAVVADLPGVGSNLQDHAGTHLVNDAAVPTLNSEARGLGGLRHMVNYALRRRGALTTAIGHAHAFVRGRPGLAAPNLQIAFAAFAFDLDEQGRLVLRPKPAVSTLVGLMRTSHRGTVRLRSADPLAPPVIAHRLLGSDDDVEQIVEGLLLARRIMAQPAIAPYLTGEVRPGAALQGDDLRGFVRMATIPLYHPVGTCAIGPRGAGGVLDPDLRVHGVDGLWVADASVMPSLPAGNTNATSIMIGDKGAAHVLRGLGNTPMLAPASLPQAA